jgi:PAS domain S-box-containing protein
LKILVIHEAEAECLRLIDALQRAGFRPSYERVESPAAMQAALARQAWDVVLAAEGLTGFGIPEALELLSSRGLDLPLIVVSAAAGEESALAALKAGAHDVVSNRHLARLGPAVERAVQRAADRQQKQRVEEELHALQRHYQDLVESLEAIVWEADAHDLRFTFVSPQGARLLGYSARQWLEELTWEQLLHPEDQASVVAACRQAIAERRNYTMECRMQGADGRIVWMRQIASVVVENRGLVKLRGVLFDITARKQLEEGLRRAQKLEAIGQLAAGIAHEINTPIQYVGDNVHFLKKAFSDLARVLDTQARLVAWMRANAGTPEAVAEILRAAEKVRVGFLQAEVPKAIEDALEGVKRVTEIVQAMKEFSHPGVDEKKPVDLNRAIESTLTVSRNEWKYVAEMVTRLDPDLPPVPCLPGELNQVILNLVVNAAHAIAEVVTEGADKGTITVSTRPCGDWVEIRVQDTGGGIPESIRSRIFDPFFTTKPVGQGTGQGLAIAHSVIVEKHGGAIEFETELGKGTTFIIRLPLRPAGMKEKEKAA